MALKIKGGLINSDRVEDFWAEDWDADVFGNGAKKRMVTRNVSYLI